MWTEITRPKYECKRLRYASNLTDEEWDLTEPPYAGGASLGLAANDGFARRGECLPLCFAQRPPVAIDGEGFSAAFDGAALFCGVAG